MVSDSLAGLDDEMSAENQQKNLLCLLAVTSTVTDHFQAFNIHPSTRMPLLGNDHALEDDPIIAGKFSVSLHQPKPRSMMMNNHRDTRSDNFDEL